MIVARYECSHCHQGRELTQEELTRSSLSESLVLELIHGLPAYARSLSCTNAKLDYAWPVPVRYPERLTFQEMHQWALTAGRLGNDVPGLAELPEEFGPYLNFAELCEDIAQDYVILKVPEGYAVFTH